MKCEIAVAAVKMAQERPDCQHDNRTSIFSSFEKKRI